MPGTIPQLVINEAKALYETLLVTESVAHLQYLHHVTQGVQVSPDDWALIQESYPKDHPYRVFFDTHRNDISSQYISNNKKCTAVPIITFTFEQVPYVLLMENKGLANSAEVNCTQWTAHGVRVDAYEHEKVSPERWHLYEQISADQEIVHFIAAAVRRIEEMGIVLNDDLIRQLGKIDRDAAGYPEKPNAYRTEYFSVDLGEKSLTEIQHLLALSPSRYSQWTQCFKLNDLHAVVQPKSLNQLGQPEEYILNYQDKNLPIRSTTWFFLAAIQLAKEMEVKPEGVIKDPWQLRNIKNIELALSWLIRWTDSSTNGSLQITLLDERNNHLTPAQIQVYAALSGLYDENLAYTSLKPERLTLHLLIAHLTAFCKLAGAGELEQSIQRLSPAFFAQHPQLEPYWQREFIHLKQYLSALTHQHLSSDEATLATLSPSELEDITQIKKLIHTIKDKQLSPLQKNLYHLRETPEEIATTIRFYEKYHHWVKTELMHLVGQFIAEEIAAGTLQALDIHSLDEHLTFGVSGPVASGKSTSETLIRQQLNGQPCAYICSDEWNVLLSAFLRLNPAHYAMPRGLLTLAEAWFIKEVIWALFNKQMQTLQKAPHWIQESCDPSSVIVPNYGQTIIYINTADPTHAAARVKERGDRSGRYVAASVATGSYRWPWANFLKTIKNSDLSKVTLLVIDTDLVYAAKHRHLEQQQRLERAKIAVVAQNQLHIHDMPRFIQLIERGYRVNPAPKNSHPDEIWLKDQPVRPEKTLQEFKNLFQQNAQLSIHFQDATLGETDLEQIVRRHYAPCEHSGGGYLVAAGGLFSGTATTSSGHVPSLSPLSP